MTGDEQKQDEIFEQIKNRIEEHFDSTPPEQVVANAESLLKREPCAHVPARPDVHLTICWKCGEEIIPDVDTLLWRELTAYEKLVKLETIRQCREMFFCITTNEYVRALWEKLETKLAPSIRLAENLFGRWVILNGRDESLAWSGSRWVPHRSGIPSGDVQICNFTTREEAHEYMKEHFTTKEFQP